ncbi:Cell division and transport-associated protein TolA (TC 2.C.1.2.1) [Desulfatibacillum alkenivorans DSM 16219]|uniref:Cell division and transport-associated protein TolA (TC 2.C.1.2.1) n=1 Tax=Desulfatibacillum alkenivorans DSM 16219 TaxID=1121393 RepID=A0A1M6DZK3_9BACT|nr:TonB family protein [Desulfatibacillum alkenivorans]SHI78692.1 Cell division and transport-associated protein TolA (TC 2.C.1.2.1) [Desulfatibacillum alkenivorans DSM 16219]
MPPKRTAPAENQSPDLPNEDGPVWMAFAGGSVALHIIVLALMIFLPQMVSSKKPSLPYLDIALTSLPTVAPGAPGPKAAPQPKTEAPKEEPEPEPVKEPEPAKEPEPVKLKPAEPKEVKQPVVVKPVEAAEISTAPKKEPDEIPVLTSLKKRTYKVEVAKDKALREIREKVESGRPSSVEDAIARMRKNPGERPKQEAKQGDGGSGGRAYLDKMEMLRNSYIQEVGAMVEMNWAMPEKYAGANLEARIWFKVHPNGNITDIGFEKRSGDKFFDDSGERAVRKSIPTKPFPPELEKTPFEMVVTFTPPET